MTLKHFVPVLLLMLVLSGCSILGLSKPPVQDVKGDAVLAIMKLSKNWNDFKRKINRVYPKYGDPYDIPFDFEDEE